MDMPMLASMAESDRMNIEKVLNSRFLVVIAMYTLNVISFNRRNSSLSRMDKKNLLWYRVLIAPRATMRNISWVIFIRRSC